MPRFRRLAVLGALSVMTSAAQSPAQDRTEQDLKALGSRVGDREQDANKSGVTGNRRVNGRIESRLDSRLDTRIERFAGPRNDFESAAIPQFSDRTKTEQ